MKKYILALLLFLMSFSIMGQSRDAELPEFLGKSRKTILNNWGAPEDSEISKDGFLIYYYTYRDATRSFYFYRDYVEMVGSAMVVRTLDYAEELAYSLGQRFEHSGYWIYYQGSEYTTLTNGYVYVDISIKNVRYNAYAFVLLVYR